MPAQTRSRGKPPPERVYHSSPAPQQLEFPRRRKTVKTYARHSTSARSLRQSTLTQIGYIEPTDPENFDMELTPEKRPQKRRKTMGDTPSVSSSSSFHTQTLTQFLSNAGNEEDDRSLDVDNNVESWEQDADVVLKPAGRQLDEVYKKALSHVTDSRATSMIPQTPVHKKSARSDVWEIPSSQPTPGGTPLGLASTPQDTARFRIQPVRSPLQDRSVNANPELPTLPLTASTVKRPPNMVIEDSYNSAPGLPSSDPLNQSPFKVPRLPYLKDAISARESVELGELPPPGQVSASRTRHPLAEIELEIPDSDDEPLSVGPTPVKSIAANAPETRFNDSPMRRTPERVVSTPKVSTDDDREIESSDAEYGDPGSPTPVARRVHSASRTISTTAGVLDKGEVHPQLPAAATPTPLSRKVELNTPQAPESSPLSSAPAETQHSARKSSESRSTCSQERAVPAEDLVETQDENTQNAVVEATPLLASQRSTGNSQLLQRSRSKRNHSRGPEVEFVVLEETQDEERPNPAAPGAVRPASQRSAPRSSQKFAPTSSQSHGTRSRRVQLEVPATTHDGDDLAAAAHPSTSQRSAIRSSQPRSTRSRKVQLDVQEATQDEDVTQDTPAGKSQYYTQTQGLESQRVPLEVIREMAPPTDRSDIIVSLHPGPAELIVKGQKTHEFRDYRIPSTVLRMWLYITAPIQELRYMAVIGPAHEPGEIDDNGGVGNREFNAGTSGSGFAYELLQVYQLNNPVSLAMMKENGWAAPQKYMYLKPAHVGALLGNLRCALFDDEAHASHEDVGEIEEAEETEQTEGRILSTPQEIEDQLRSDIMQSTQKVSGLAADEDIVLSSQDERSSPQHTPVAKRSSDEVFARPQLPASKTPASNRRLPSQQQQLPPSAQRPGAVRPSQATTASDASSPAASPQKSLPRLPTGSSGAVLPEYGEEESPMGFMLGQHYSLGSSQLRVPESLIRDDIRPPRDIRDSDDDSDVDY